MLGITALLVLGTKADEENEEYTGHKDGPPSSAEAADDEGPQDEESEESHDSGSLARGKYSYVCCL